MPLPIPPPMDFDAMVPTKGGARPAPVQPTPAKPQAEPAPDTAPAPRAPHRTLLQVFTRTGP